MPLEPGLISRDGWTVVDDSTRPLFDSDDFSFARGEERAESDIDLMVIGEVTLDDLLGQVSPLERKLNRPINPTIYAREELRTKLHAGNHFLGSIQSAQLIFLIGNENEFREIR